MSEPKPTLHWPLLGCPDAHHVCVDTEFSREWESAPHGDPPVARDQGDPVTEPIDAPSEPGRLVADCATPGHPDGEHRCVTITADWPPPAAPHPLGDTETGRWRPCPACGMTWADCYDIGCCDSCDHRALLAAAPAPTAPTRPAPLDPDCLARWPEAEPGAYDPRCCRFPKSCSSWMPDRAPAPTEAGASVVKWPAAWDHCYEDMGDDPCGRPPVGARPDPEGGDLYPVCREHLRP